MRRIQRIGRNGIQVPLHSALRIALLAIAFVPAAHAQFELALASGAPVPPVYDLGQYYVGETAAAHFRLRNSSAAPATLTTLTVAGVGFTLTAPAMPVGLAPQGAVDLTVNFRSGETGSYSAAFLADGISVLLTARVIPGLTYRVDSGGGPVPLIPPAMLDFGSVVRGGVAQRRITVRNETSAILIVPGISIQGIGFSLAAPAPSGQTLQPQQGGEFSVVFHPVTADGTHQGVLTIGDRSYPLLGVSAEPPLPRPSLAIDLPTVASAQQGTLVIRFDAPAQTTGTGTATLDFRGPDAAIAFAAGGRSTNFAVAPGDTQAVLPFQTGTTAGVLTFTVQIGQAVDQQSVTIPAAAVAIGSAQGLRLSGAIEIRVTGFDNTRTLGALGFTFYDTAGKAIASVSSDATGDFARFFAGSDLGGQFLLRAVFPVSGDASLAAACDVSLTSSKGTAVRRVPLQ